MTIDIVFIFLYIKDMKRKTQQISKINDFLNIIADINRMQILKYLSNGEKCVCEIWKYLDLPQNLVSHHLKVIKDLNLISSKKDGLNVIYQLNKDVLEKNIKLLTKYLTTKGE